MSNDQPRYWFPAKKYGWGWSLPITWQGWDVFRADVRQQPPILTAHGNEFIHDLRCNPVRFAVRRLLDQG